MITVVNHDWLILLKQCCEKDRHLIYPVVFAATVFLLQRFLPKERNVVTALYVNRKSGHVQEQRCGLIIRKETTG